MEHRRTRIIADGAVAGILGAVTVAVWFLVLDTARGSPFETPALLAAALFHGLHWIGPSTGVAQLVSEYTAIHVAAFVAVGIVGALLLEAAERERGLTIPLAVFLAAFEVFFIALVMFLGPAVMEELTWWGIAVANLLATAVMAYYFLSRHPAIARSLLGPWMAVVREGVVAGIIGAVVVAAWFFVMDLAAGEAFRTPLALGRAIIDGDAAHPVWVVAAYTVPHFLAFVLCGLALAVMMAGAEREPFFALGGLVVFVIVEVFFFGLVTLVDAALLSELGWWKIIAGNVLALAAMAAYFAPHHRGMIARLKERWGLLETEGEEPDLKPRRAGR